MSQDKRYWFAAKRYGWGWGLPSAWQGWVVLVGYLVVVASSGFVVRSHQYNFNGANRLEVIIVATLALVGLCMWKGEPACWRWGNKQ